MINISNQSGCYDIVCGMKVKADTPYRHIYKEQELLFCSNHCLEKFRNDPEQYLNLNNKKISSDRVKQYSCPEHPEIKQNRTGNCSKCGIELIPEKAFLKTEWTCPMHPEIIRQEPGNCPKCGMALEPRTAIIEQDVKNTDLQSMQLRFLVCTILTIPLFIIAMIHMLANRSFTIINPEWQKWIELTLASPIVLWGGWLFFVRAWQSVVNKSLNMFTLIGLGVSVAYIYSVIATIFPFIFPTAFRDQHGNVAIYFEAAAVITTLVLLGQVLELRARSRTGAAIKALFGLAPKTARKVYHDGKE